jgi:hypothetical protein
MSDYEHHIFLSYRRFDDDWRRWTRENFVRTLKSLLQPGLGDVKIYVDESMENGASWPQHLALNLSRSRLMVAVFSRQYFQSDWCTSELSLMRHRETLTNLRTSSNPLGLIIPVVIDDGNCFPIEVQSMKAEPLHEYANPFMKIDSPNHEVFASILKNKICPAIEVGLKNVPAFDPSWEQIACNQFENTFKINARTQETLPPLVFKDPQ